MRNKLLLSLCITIIIGCSKNQDNIQYRLITSNIALHEHSTSSSKVIIRLKKGARVRVSGRSLKSEKDVITNKIFSWFFIQYESKSGWVYGKYLNKLKGEKQIMMTTLFTDDEYNAYINKFKKFLINEFVYSIEFEDEFESRIVVDESLNVTFYPGEDSIFKSNKNVYKGHLNIHYKLNKIPEAKVILDDTKTIPLEVIYHKTFDRLQFNYYMPKEEFIKFKEGLEKDASTQ